MARAAPGKLLYAAAGNGSVHTLAMEQFKYITKTNIEHVPFKNSNDAVNDVVAGRVDMMMLPIAAAASFVQNGQVRCSRPYPISARGCFQTCRPCRRRDIRA